MKAKTLLLSVLSVCLLIYPSTLTHAEEESNPGLSAKINYFSGYTRLSEALSQISQLSGTKILAGKSTSDWQVRDMPVVICANNIEAGKLLRLITDTYSLSISETDVDGSPVYRLYRPKAYQDALNTTFNDSKNDDLKNSAFQWQTFSWVGSLKENDLERLYQDYKKKGVFSDFYQSTDAEPGKLAFDEIVLYGRLINSISNADYSRLINGETIVISAEQGGEVGKLVKDFTSLKVSIAKALRQKYSKGNSFDDYPSDSDIEKAQIEFKMNAISGFSPGSSVHAGPFLQAGFQGDLLTFAMACAPMYIPKSQPEPVFPMKYLRSVSNEMPIKPQGEYEFKLDSKEKLKLADILTTVSKATGYSLVADDYCDQKDNPGILCNDLFTGKKTMTHVMKALGSDYKWYSWPKKKAFSVKAAGWYSHYANLVPKEMYEGWLKNANGSGLELTDFLNCFRLAIGQQQDWVRGIKPLSGLLTGSFVSNQKDYLDILALLNPSDLSAALKYKMPLSRIDKNQLTRFFNSLPEGYRPQEDVSTLWMQIVPHKLDRDKKRHTYTIEIKGNNTDLKYPVDLIFPIYTPDKGSKSQASIINGLKR